MSDFVVLEVMKLEIVLFDVVNFLLIWRMFWNGLVVLMLEFVGEKLVLFVCIMFLYFIRFFFEIVVVKFWGKFLFLFLYVGIFVMWFYFWRLLNCILDDDFSFFFGIVLWFWMKDKLGFEFNVYIDFLGYWIWLFFIWNGVFELVNNLLRVLL